ncbi:MAG: ATP-binding protein [Bacteroidota bacterium]
MLRVAKSAIDSARIYNKITEVHTLTTYYLKKPSYDSIIYYSDKVLALTENKESKEYIEQFLAATCSKGIAYKALGDLTTSLDYFNAVIAITENIDDPTYFFLQREIATTLTAGIYATQKNYELAIKQYDHLFKYIEKKGIDPTLVSSIVHLRYARFNRELKNMEIALAHVQKAMDIATRNNLDFRQAMIFLEKAHIYVDIEEVRQAETCLKKAYKVLSSDAKYTTLLTKYYYLKAILSGKTNNITAKIQYAEKAFHLVFTERISPRHIATANLLYEAYKEKGLYKKAVAVLEKIVSFEKAISDNEQLKKSALFEIERRDKNIVLAEAKNKTMNQMILCIVLLFMIACLIAIYIYKDRKKKIKLAREIAKRNQQLEQLDKAKSNFFSNITHELQTPLTLIEGPLEQALQDTGERLDTITKSNLQMAMNNTASLKTLVNDILDLSKLKAKKLQLHDQSTDIDTFLNVTLRKFSPLMQQKKLHFHFCCKDLENHHATIDTKKLEKILNNLISNAIKYTPANGTISVSGKLSAEDTLIISITDTGVGIPKADIPHIFDRYFQSKDTSKPLEGGCGIGLSLVKELVELMNGTIAVQSELAKGSQFTVTIPLKEIHKKTQKEYVTTIIPTITPALSDASVHIDHISETMQKHTILIVEDHQEMQHFIASILQKNYRLVIANNGKEAMEKLKQSSVDLIVSDVMMPAMDGFTFVETLKKSESYAGIPIIMLTALSDVNYKLKALTIGVDDYINKPFLAPELLARVHNLVVRYQTKKEYVLENVATIAHEEKVAKVFAPQAKPSVVIEKSDAKLVAKVAEIIKQNMDNPDFKLTELTKKVHLGERQLRRKIKLITGLSPKKFQQEIQLLEARTILEEGRYNNAKAVALSVGMDNTSRFNKLYVERFGKHPAHYFTC